MAAFQRSAQGGEGKRGKAIIFRPNSPGSSIPRSGEIYFPFWDDTLYYAQSACSFSSLTCLTFWEVRYVRFHFCISSILSIILALRHTMCVASSVSKHTHCPSGGGVAAQAVPAAAQQQAEIVDNAKLPLSSPKVCKSLLSLVFPRSLLLMLFSPSVKSLFHRTTSTRLLNAAKSLSKLTSL